MSNLVAIIIVFSNHYCVQQSFSFVISIQYRTEYLHGILHTRQTTIFIVAMVNMAVTITRHLNNKETVTVLLFIIMLKQNGSEMHEC